MGLGRSGSESGPSVCDLGPFLGSGVQTIVHMNSLRGLCVSGQECVLRLVLPARCHQHGLSTHQRLQPFPFLLLGLVQFVAPMRAISVHTFLKTPSLMFCRAGNASLISTAARSCGFVCQSRPGTGFSSCCMALVFGHTGPSRYRLGPEHGASSCA